MIDAVTAKARLKSRLAQLASNAEPAPVLSQCMSEGWQDKVYVKPSPIQGLGVFARRVFRTGEPILVREQRPVTPEQPLDPNKGEYEHHCDWLEGGHQVYLGFPERHINHSCDANSYVRFQDGASTNIAIRPIRANEEITNHYGIGLWDGEDWQCNCGSQRCLGTVPGSFFRLPLDVQIELSPFLPDWFIEEHRPEYDAFLRAAGLDAAAE